MLAHAVDVDVLNDDHPVVGLLEESIVDDIAKAHAGPLRQEQKRFCISLRRVAEPLSTWILSNAFEERLDSTAHSLEPLVFGALAFDLDIVAVAKLRLA